MTRKAVTRRVVALGTALLGTAPAQAITWQQILEAGLTRAVGSLDIVSFIQDPDQALKTAAIQFASGAVSVPLSDGIEDLITSLNTSNEVVQDIGNLFRGAEEYNLGEIVGATKALFDDPSEENFKKLATRIGIETDALNQSWTEQVATYTRAGDLQALMNGSGQSSQAASLLTNLEDGGKLAIDRASQDLMQSLVQGSKTKFLEAASNDAAEHASGEDAQEVNKDQRKRVADASRQLAIDTITAPSTRATVAALNDAVSAYMVNAHVDSQILLSRLNLLIQQETLNNAQMADIVRALDREHQSQIAQHVDNVIARSGETQGQAGDVLRSGLSVSETMLLSLDDPCAAKAAIGNPC